MTLGWDTAEMTADSTCDGIVGDHWSDEIWCRAQSAFKKARGGDEVFLGVVVKVRCKPCLHIWKQM